MKQKILIAGVLLSTGYSCVSDCLSAGTKIKTDKKIKDIEDLTVGDRVITLLNGRITTAKVMKFVHGRTNSLCKLKTTSTQIETSPLHRVHLNNSFVESFKAKRDDIVSMFHGKEPLLSKSITLTSNTVDVFSISLDRGFVYFANEFLVHNKTVYNQEITCPEIRHEGIRQVGIKLIKNSLSNAVTSVSLRHECEQKVSKIELDDSTNSFSIDAHYDESGNLLYIVINFSPQEKGNYRARLIVESNEGEDSVDLLGEYK